ncbi:MAG TPA: CBO0543 family protein [Syntrophomonadaceae bacterium]|nr:CBO0543 family protein [Syntrophomonadaceae bacterium]
MKIFQSLHVPPKLLTDPGFSRVLELKSQADQAQLANWLYDDLHKWTWWLNLIAVILPIIILWKVMDRKRFLQILVFGFLTAMVSTFFNTLGIALMLWDYPDRFLPISPRLFPVDFVALPFLYMLVYQYYLNWKDFVIANTILAAVLSFVLEPVLVWLNLYELITWRYYYSFPIYIVMPIAARWLTSELVSQDLNYRIKV